MPSRCSQVSRLQSPSSLIEAKDNSSAGNGLSSDTISTRERARRPAVTAISSLITRADAHVEAHLEGWLDEAARLCRQPSISAQNLGIEECAELLARIFRERGYEAQIFRKEGCAPVVYAEMSGQSDRTLLLYNHYDVQPPEPLELWDSPPFEPRLEGDGRDRVFFARGAVDDKGHIVSRLAAIEAVRSAGGGLPCRVKFVVEGEEETSSRYLPEFVHGHRDLLRADACIWESGGVNHLGQTQLYCGMRGICYVELTVRTANRDTHSGQGGSVFPNAAWRLTWALASLKGPDERIRIPGFHDAVVPPSPADLELLAALPDEEAELRRSYELKRFLGDLTGLEFRRAKVFEPTCTICGLDSGYQGPGCKTVLPAAATAKVDFRLVPDQDPQDVVAKLRRHLDAEGFADVEIAYLGGEKPARVDPNDPFVRLAAETAAEVYTPANGLPAASIAPIVGGSGPMHPFAAELRLPIATPGISHPEGRAHAPNENFRVNDFVRGTKHLARIIARWGASP
ncbi:MAG: M20/M25/M40 family metallo-hydrolase [Chloroflexi bacterium]|nr:M20/M25/M40 family metallo-hydrolase [Chloroflexota bacterium]